jgi:hypothetical protein
VPGRSKCRSTSIVDLSAGGAWRAALLPFFRVLVLMCRASGLLRRRAKPSGKVSPPAPVGNKVHSQQWGEKGPVWDTIFFVRAYCKASVPSLRSGTRHAQVLSRRLGPRGGLSQQVRT